MANKHERRSVNRTIEVRAEDGKPAILSGYGAVYYDGSDGSEFRLYDDFVERIMPGAFDRAVREDDVRALFNHDPNMILGRKASGTLRLSVDATGLKYEIDLPDSPQAESISASVKRGDVTGSSFSFEVISQSWREENGVMIRLLEDVRLYDVGPVTFPAYEATTAEAASAAARAGLAEEAEKHRKALAGIRARSAYLATSQKAIELQAM